MPGIVRGQGFDAGALRALNSHAGQAVRLAGANPAQSVLCRQRPRGGASRRCPFEIGCESVATELFHFATSYLHPIDARVDNQGDHLAVEIAG